jgi:hypothetical protein
MDLRKLERRIMDLRIAGDDRTAIELLEENLLSQRRRTIRVAIAPAGAAARRSTKRCCGDLRPT